MPGWKPLARDLVQRSGSAQRVANAQDKDVIDWLLSSLEIGHVVIALREQMNEIDHEGVTRALTISLARIADLYASPSTAHRQAAILAIKAAMTVLADSGGQMRHASRHQLRVMLHFINSVLLDEKSVLAAPATRKI